MGAGPRRRSSGVRPRRGGEAALWSSSFKPTADPPHAALQQISDRAEYGLASAPVSMQQNADRISTGGLRLSRHTHGQRGGPAIRLLRPDLLDRDLRRFRCPPPPRQRR